MEVYGLRGLFGPAMPREAAAIDAKQLSRILRLALGDHGPKQQLLAENDPDRLTSGLKEVLLDVLRATPHMSEGLMRQGAQKA